MTLFYLVPDPQLVQHFYKPMNFARYGHSQWFGLKWWEQLNSRWHGHFFRAPSEHIHVKNYRFVASAMVIDRQFVGVSVIPNPHPSGCLICCFEMHRKNVRKPQITRQNFWILTDILCCTLVLIIRTKVWRLQLRNSSCIKFRIFNPHLQHVPHSKNAIDIRKQIYFILGILQEFLKKCGKSICFRLLSKSAPLTHFWDRRGSAGTNNTNQRGWRHNWRVLLISHASSIAKLSTHSARKAAVSCHKPQT